MSTAVFQTRSELSSLLPYLSAREREQLDRLLRPIAQRTSDPVSWIEREFYIPELGGPIQLAPYQRAVLREALRRDASGRYVYSTVVWSDIKKSAKSTLAAAVVLWDAWHTPWSQYVIVANDLKQADTRVAYYLRRAIELHPRLRERCAIHNFRVHLPNKSVIESVPIDPSGEAGANARRVVFSELWGAHHKAQVRMWTEMTLPPALYGQSQRWVETYAGYTGESTLLEQLYAQGVKGGRRLDLSYEDADGYHDLADLEVYANHDARLLVLWNTTPRLPWQTEEYYRQEEATLPHNEFRRVHKNEWVTSEEAFIPKEWWDQCYDPAIPPLSAAAGGKLVPPLVVAVDAGVSSDSFGIVAVSRRKVGADWHVDVRYVRQWRPGPGGKLLFSNPKDPDDPDYPEGALARLCRTCRVVQVAYDPYQLHKMATDLRERLNVWFREFGQGQERAVADKQLRDLIRDGRVHHDGHPDLTEHILNANAKSEGERLRLVKRGQGQKIDLAVCLSMATAEALRLNL